MVKKRFHNNRIFLYAVLLFFSVIIILPYLWILTMSLKPVRAIFSPPYLIPVNFHWKNYLEAWNAAPFARFYFNTTVMTVFIVAGQVIFSAMAAYAFARLKFPGRDILFFIFLGTMMVPFQAIMIPSYLIVLRLGWIDTYYALIVPRLVSAFGIFLLRQYFITIPYELDQAASIDGCTKLGILWQIIIPLSMPAVSALAIFSFLFAWNDFLWPLIVINKPSMRTIQLGLAMFQGKYGTRWNYLMAGTVTATVPSIVVFLLGQKRFIEGITLTGLKG